MNLKIYADLHLGGPHAINVVLKYGQGIVYLGDTFDIKNTKKKDLVRAREEQERHNLHCDETGTINVVGNHCLCPKGKTVHVERDILITHGHLICWSADKVKKWEEMEPQGIGKLKWMALEIKHRFGRGEWNPNIVEKEMAYKLAVENGCRVVLIGHTHTSKIVDVVYKDIRIINVGRGVTNLAL